MTAEDQRLLALGRRVDAMLKGSAPGDDLGALLRDWFAQEKEAVDRQKREA